MEIDAFIKLINTNGDKVIQKEELTEFLKSQDAKNPSVFSGYFDSIKDSDVSINAFIKGINDAGTEAYKSGKKDFTLHFKDEKAKKQYDEIKAQQKRYESFYTSYAWRFKSDDDFKKAYENSDIKTDEDVKKFLEKANASPEEIMARLNMGKFPFLPQDFQHRKFDNIDLSKYPKAIRHTCFNKNTYKNAKNFPKGFVPEEVIEKGKTIGLGIDEVHKMGYTGKGVSFAVVDGGTICDNGKQHKALKFKEYYVPKSANCQNPNNFHGFACSYIAQEISPEADCYYYVKPDYFSVEANAKIENLKAILEKNKTLPDDKKIRVVSMSFPFEGDAAKALPIVKELEAQGVWCLSSEQFWEKGFAYCEKIDPNGDPNDFNNYQIALGGGADDLLYVNSGDRTLPDPSDENAFRHDSPASASWAIPVVASYYVLACQADSSMTPERFMKLARSTARTIESTEPVYDRKWNKIGRTKETKPIKMIDIKALIKAIEAEKTGR